MKYEQKIIKAFKSSWIEKILLIDDAYDPPEVNQGALTEFLENTGNHSALFECEIEKPIIEEAIKVAADFEISGHSDDIYGSLYQKFVETGEERFDPGGKFEQGVKGGALAVLRPLFALLSRSVGRGNVRTAGLHDGMECYRKFDPQTVFMDYYLDSRVSHEGDASQGDKLVARRASEDLTRQIIYSDMEKKLSIVLMSSYTVQEDGDASALKSGHMSLRFQCLNKNSVRYEGEDIVIDPLAVDVLLDVASVN